MAKMKETMLASEASSGNTQMAFLTLKDGVAETDEERAKLGSQWAALLVTNAVKISYHMIGGNELLITEEQGRIMEIKDFVLQQPEVAKFRWKVRRAGGRNMGGGTRRTRAHAFLCVCFLWGAACAASRLPAPRSPPPPSRRTRTFIPLRLRARSPKQRGSARRVKQRRRRRQRMISEALARVLSHGSVCLKGAV